MKQNIFTSIIGSAYAFLGAHLKKILVYNSFVFIFFTFFIVVIPHFSTANDWHILGTYHRDGVEHPIEIFKVEEQAVGLLDKQEVRVGDWIQFYCQLEATIIRAKIISINSRYVSLNIQKNGYNRSLMLGTPKVRNMSYFAETGEYDLKPGTLKIINENGTPIPSRQPTVFTIKGRSTSYRIGDWIYEEYNNGAFRLLGPITYLDGHTVAATYISFMIRKLEGYVLPNDIIKCNMYLKGFVDPATN